MDAANTITQVNDSTAVRKVILLTVVEHTFLSVLFSYNLCNTFLVDSCKSKTQIITHTIVLQIA